MSKYQTFKDVQFRDERLLCRALEALGWQVEKGESLTMRDYYGNDYAQKVQLCVRGAGSYRMDIGFRRGDRGFEPILDETSPTGFITRIRTAYSEQVVQEVARRMRGTVLREQEGSLTKLRVRF